MPDLDLQPTEEMASNAARGLELREKHGRGGTAIGVARARDIKNRKNLSERTVRRMHAFFSRHEGNQAGGEDDAGYIAWLLWGGDAGRSWARRKVEQMNNKDESSRPGAKVRFSSGAGGAREILRVVGKAFRESGLTRSDLKKAHPHLNDRVENLERVPHLYSISEALAIADQIRRVRSKMSRSESLDATRNRIMRSTNNRPGAKARFETSDSDHRKEAQATIDLISDRPSRLKKEAEVLASNYPALERHAAEIYSLRNSTSVREIRAAVLAAQKWLNDFYQQRGRPERTLVGFDATTVQEAQKLAALYGGNYRRRAAEWKRAAQGLISKASKIESLISETKSLLRSNPREAERTARKADSLARERNNWTYSRPGAKAKFGLERIVNDILHDAGVRDDSWNWLDGTLIVKQASKDFVMNALQKAVESGELTQLPPRIRLRPSVYGSRPGAKARFSDDNRPVEAYGVKGMNSTPWRKTFKNWAALEKWVEANNAEVHGTRDADNKRYARDGAKARFSSDPEALLSELKRLDERLDVLRYEIHDLQTRRMMQIGSALRQAAKSGDQGAAQEAAQAIRILKDQLKLILNRNLFSRPGAKAGMSKQDPISKKIATLTREGYDAKQSAAIAYDMKRRGEI